MFHTHKHTSTQSLTHSHSHSSLTLTGVPLVPLGLRRFCVAGVAQRALARGRMYALASLWRPSGAPWSPPLLRRRRGTPCIGKGSHVRPGVPLASLWCPLVSAAFAWQAWTNVHWQGVGCTPWLASLWCHLVSAAFAWQAWHTVHWQGVGCTPWRPSGVPLASLWRPSGAPWSLPLLRGRRGTTCIAKGSDVRPGVPWAPPLCRCLLRGRRGTICSARGPGELTSKRLKLNCTLLTICICLPRLSTRNGNCKGSHCGEPASLAPRFPHIDVWGFCF